MRVGTFKANPVGPGRAVVGNAFFEHRLWGWVLLRKEGNHLGTFKANLVWGGYL